MSTHLKYKTRSDGFIWYCGSWRRPDAVEKIAARAKKKYWADPEKSRAKRREARKVSKDKDAATRRAYRKENLEEARRKDRVYKAEYRIKSSKKLKATRRKWYDKNKHSEYARNLKRKQRINPTYGLHWDIIRFKRGEITIHELNLRYSNALERLNESLNKKPS